MSVTTAQVAIVLLVSAGVTYLLVSIVASIVRWKRPSLSFKDIIRDSYDYPSLSTFQFLVWTIIVIWAFLSVYLVRVVGGFLDPPKEVPIAILSLMGISAGVPLLSGGVSNVKYSPASAPTPARTPSTPTAAQPGIAASAAADRTRGVAPLAVQFSGSASGGSPPYSYSWTFGDGATSDDQKPTHRYPTTPGTYTATLTASDKLGARVSSSISINNIPRLSTMLEENGRLSLTRFQMFSWTWISVLIYLVIFVARLRNPVVLSDVSTLTLPDIDTSLVVLMGLSQGAYLGGKIVVSTAMNISSIIPNWGIEGKLPLVSVVGFDFGVDKGLVVFKDKSGLDYRFGGNDLNWGSTMIDVTLTNLKKGTYEVRVVARGTEARADKKFTVDLAAPAPA